MLGRSDYRDGYYGGDGQPHRERDADEILRYLLVDPDYDPEDDDLDDLLEGRPEDDQEPPEQVEHQVDHGAGDAEQLDAEAQFGWRNAARRGRRGRFVPPDMRAYRWPAFVRVEDLQIQDGG